MINVQSTGDISLAQLENAFAASPLGEITKIDERQYFFKSVEPPSWVQLLASVEAWQALLGAGVSLYVSSIIAEAGKETWKSRKSINKAVASGSQMLLQLAKRLVTLQSLVGQGTTFEVGIPFEDDRYSALLPITTSSAENIELQLAQFSIHAKTLGELLSRTDVKPVGWIILSLTENGDLFVQWMDCDSLKQREETLSLKAALGG